MYICIFTFTYFLYLTVVFEFLTFPYICIFTYLYIYIYIFISGFQQWQRYVDRSCAPLAARAEEVAPAGRSRWRLGLARARATHAAGTDRLAAGVPFARGFGRGAWLDGHLGALAGESEDAGAATHPAMFRGVGGL